MELSERKRRILGAIIESYIETAEPVGSRTIAKLADMSISSATIRNEMADLEEMGLLVPAVKDEVSGYRYYSADNMTQIRSIRSLQQLGLTLKEVEE